VIEVVLPVRTPRRACDRGKAGRRDAVMLAFLSRAGEVTSAWVPDEAREAIRDLIRGREAAVKDVGQIPQRIQSFLLRKLIEIDGTRKESLVRWLRRKLRSLGKNLI
jgi:transposase